MVEYGVLQTVVLYKDLRGDRWRYAIYDTTGVWDGWLVGLHCIDSFEVAAETLEAFIAEHWEQRPVWQWTEGRPDWWNGVATPSTE